MTLRTGLFGEWDSAFLSFEAEGLHQATPNLSKNQVFDRMKLSIEFCGIPG